MAYKGFAKFSNNKVIKNKIFQQCYKQQNIDLISKYKSYRNKLTKLKEMAKMTYYQNELQMHKENISKQCRVTNEIICYKQNNTIAYLFIFFINLFFLIAYH